MNLTLRGFMKKEFLQTLRDPRMSFFVFGAPLLQLLVFGYAISTEVRNIRLAAQYAPGDQLARRIEARALSSGWFVPVTHQGEDPFALVQSGRADVALVAPAGGLSRAARRGDARLQVLVDATNVIQARAVERYLGAIVQGVIQETFPGQAPPSPLGLEIRTLYNPAQVTTFHMVPGVMLMLLSLLTILLPSMSLVREKETGTFETLVSAPVKNWEILLGKTLPFMILGLVLVHLIFLAAVLIFGLPMRGAYWKFLLAAVMFIISTISVGTMISTISRGQQQAMMGSFFFLFPAIMLSGMMFPLENMPQALVWAAYLNPLKYMLTLLRNILLKGGDDWVFWTNLGALAILALAAATFSFKRFRQTLN